MACDGSLGLGPDEGWQDKRCVLIQSLLIPEMMCPALGGALWTLAGATWAALPLLPREVWEEKG